MDCNHRDVENSPCNYASDLVDQGIQDIKKTAKRDGEQKMSYSFIYASTE